MAAISTASPLLQYRKSCLRFTSTRFKFMVRASATAGRSAAASMGSNSRTYSTELEEKTSLIMKDYFEWSKDMIGSGSDCGPPRWFSPLDSAAPPTNDSPLLLYLPGDP